MRLGVCFAAMLLLAGCATDALQSYIGQPVSAMIPTYGMPSGQYDVDSNKRAFVWQKEDVSISPGESTPSSANVTTSRCAYVVYAHRTRTDIDGPAAWTIQSYQQPRWQCAFGLQ